ncbi:MAG TPA: signal peptidase I [Gaiellaceae bacterium]
MTDASRRAPRQPAGIWTIERIVRAELLLLVPLLCATAAGLRHGSGAGSVLGLTAICLALVAIARGLSAVPARELAAPVINGLLVSAALAFVAVAILPRLGWYRPLTVLSGSMRPTFSPGDLIIVRPEPLRDVHAGQVIAYHVPVADHQLETHRVIRILRGGPNPIVQTQGDANNWHDPWNAELHGSTAWRLSLVIPAAGYAINALQSRLLHLVAVVAAPLLIALLALARLWDIPCPCPGAVARAPRNCARRSRRQRRASPGRRPA